MFDVATADIVALEVAEYECSGSLRYIVPGMLAQNPDYVRTIHPNTFSHMITIMAIE